MAGDKIKVEWLYFYSHHALCSILSLNIFQSPICIFSLSSIKWTILSVAVLLCLQNLCPIALKTASVLCKSAKRWEMLRILERKSLCVIIVVVIIDGAPWALEANDGKGGGSGSECDNVRAQAIFTITLILTQADGSGNCFRIHFDGERLAEMTTCHIVSWCSQYASVEMWLQLTEKWEQVCRQYWNGTRASAHTRIAKCANKNTQLFISSSRKVPLIFRNCARIEIAHIMAREREREWQSL